MKAARYNRYGDSDVLRYEEVERPAPELGQVLVKVAGTSFNQVDAGIRGGYLSEVFAIIFPHVPGIDVAGTVVEIGDGVTGWQAGAAPRSMELADSAALPTVGLTAW